jgi:hypothetical protein
VQHSVVVCVCSLVETLAAQHMVCADLESGAQGSGCSGSSSSGGGGAISNFISCK